MNARINFQTLLGLDRGNTFVAAASDITRQVIALSATVNPILANASSTAATHFAGLNSSIAQQLLEARRVLWRADQQDVPHAGQHQGAERVVHHGLVVNGQQLFADGQGGRVQAGAGATGEDDAFACSHGF